MSKSNQRGDVVTGLTVGIVLVIIALIALPIWLSVHFATNHHDVTFTVNKSERVTEGSKSSKYLIYTTDGVYENTDSVWNGKFNSSDLYNDIVVGKTYTCDAVGFRNGFWSTYENLISCKEVKA